MPSAEQLNNAREDDHELVPRGQSTNVSTVEDTPPDGGYGWVCCICVFLINANAWGVNSAWGVFLAHYISRGTFNATQLEYALIGGLSISQALLVSPIVSLSNEKLGTLTSLLIGTSLVSLSMLTSSFATEVWHLFLSQGAAFGYGMGFLYLTASTILPSWFLKRRSLAVGIASSGAGFGGLAYNLGTGAAVESLGLAWTYRLLALSTLLVNASCSLLLKERKKTTRPKQKMFSWSEFAQMQVILVIIWGFATELGYIVLLYSLPNYAISIGLTAKQGSIVGAVLNLGLAFGRPAVGYWSDRFGRINIAMLMTALCGVFCLGLWVPAKSYAVLLVFALASGTVTGTFWGCVVPVTAEVVGMARLSSAFGMICLPLVLPTTFAEPIALALKDASGYLTSQIFVGIMFLLGAISMWALRCWKIWELETKQMRERDAEEVGGVRHGAIWLTPRRMFLLQKV